MPASSSSFAIFSKYAWNLILFFLEQKDKAQCRPQQKDQSKADCHNYQEQDSHDMVSHSRKTTDDHCSFAQINTHINSYCVKIGATAVIIYSPPAHQIAPLISDLKIFPLEIQITSSIM